MGLTVRDARDADDLDALNVGNRTWLSAGTIRGAFMAAPAGMRQALLVAELDGAPAGYGHAVAAGIRDGYRAMAAVYVLPAHRGHGLGGALWSRVLEICTPDLVHGVMLSADAADAASLEIATAHGLRLAGLHLESFLDLTGNLPAMSVDGIELRPVADSDAGWEMAHELHARLGRETPDAGDGNEDMPFGVYRVFHAEPWQVLLAYDGDLAVGFTAVMLSRPADRELNTSLTAVAREYRGRGLATALKASHAQALADAGWRGIRTQNMAGNEPILAANRRLGFTPVGGTRDLVYDFSASAG